MYDSGDKRGDIGTLRGCAISWNRSPVVRVLKTLWNITVQELFQEKKERLWKEETINRR